MLTTLIDGVDRCSLHVPEAQNTGCQPGPTEHIKERTKHEPACPYAADQRSRRRLRPLVLGRVVRDELVPDAVVWRDRGRADDRGALLLRADAAVRSNQHHDDGDGDCGDDGLRRRKPRVHRQFLCGEGDDGCAVHGPRDDAVRDCLEPGRARDGDPAAAAPRPARASALARSARGADRDQRSGGAWRSAPGADPAGIVPRDVYLRGLQHRGRFRDRPRGGGSPSRAGGVWRRVRVLAVRHRRRLLDGDAHLRRLPRRGVPFDVLRPVPGHRTEVRTAPLFLARPRLPRGFRFDGHGRQLADDRRSAALDARDRQARPTTPTRPSRAG